MSPAPPEKLLAAVAFDAGGLVPVIAQEAHTGMVRMFAWANRDALAKTLETGAAHFWSRSRQAMWRKGESSGNTLAVRQIRIDCDGDVVLYLVEPDGPSCHTGATSCFYRRVDADGALQEDDAPPDPPALVLARVAEVIAKRRRERPEKSYVVSLLDGGLPKINAKITEEAGELVEALARGAKAASPPQAIAGGAEPRGTSQLAAMPGGREAPPSQGPELAEGDAAHTAHEAADLLFHVLVGLEAAGVPLDAVFDQLRGRFGISGIDEKAGRKPK